MAREGKKRRISKHTWRIDTNASHILPKTLHLASSTLISFHCPGDIHPDSGWQGRERGTIRGHILVINKTLLVFRSLKLEC
jgi:hypothetical protein